MHKCLDNFIDLKSFKCRAGQELSDLAELLRKQTSRTPRYHRES